MNPLGALAAVLIYSALAAVAEAMLWRKWRALSASGLQPVFPISVGSVPLPIDRKSALAAAAEVVALWPAVEEVVYRIVPFIAAGLPGAAAMVPVWALTHAAKFYEYNKHLPDDAYMGFLKVYLASLSLIGIGLTLSIPLSGELWMPMLLHMVTNYAALESLRRRARPPKVERPQFLRPAQKRSTTSTSPRALRFAGMGRVRTEYLD
ncbi:MAG: CPBP family glutamic-type intramembrane protease [Desulfurococcaceae archaeon]